MTNNNLTETRLAEIAEDGFLEHGDAKKMATELQQYRKAASVPVAWTDAEELRDINNGYTGYLFAIGGEANKFADPRRQIMLYTVPPASVEPYSVIGWLRSDYNSDDKRDPNAPLFMLGSNDPSATRGVTYMPLGNSPVIPDWHVEAERMAELHGASFVIFRHGEKPVCADPSKFWFGYDPAAPEQGSAPCTK
ncbi:hypothetical protein [Yokenella regensburgei]|uniref:hypothetical protein n=1 Tax=Yokenella regensburgei TaxID=158877 RepID=UPI001ADDEA75|nr:hypothetical protein [Yokenella regensburgei]